VIIGKLIPAGTGLLARRRAREALLAGEVDELELLEGDGLNGDGLNGDGLNGDGISLDVDDDGFDSLPEGELVDVALAGGNLDQLDES
jgi:hypothetical protein